VVALMVGTAVQRLSNCVTDDMSMNDNNSTSSGDDTTNSTAMMNNETCENDPVDIAVTLALLIGILMVSN